MACLRGGHRGGTCDNAISDGGSITCWQALRWPPAPRPVRFRKRWARATTRRLSRNFARRDCQRLLSRKFRSESRARCRIYAAQRCRRDPVTTPIRVLYAEGDATVAEQTKLAFAAHAPDLQLEIVGTGRTCLVRLAETNYDVLLLDSDLPDMDGVDLLKRLADAGTSLPIVMVTATGDEALVVQVIGLGACDYVPKQGAYLERLPGILRSVVAEFRTAQDRPVAGRQQRRILYVASDSTDRDLTLKYFDEATPHFTLEVVRSASRALELLQQTPFDLVLADLDTQAMGALGLLREVKHHGFLLPFVILTSGGDEKSAVAALKLGAYEYIVKRRNYIAQLPYAIDHAISRFQLVQVNRRLHEELQKRERLQQTMAESLALLDTLQKHAPIGIAFMDRNYRFQRVNDELAAINGLPASAHLGRTVAEVVPAIWPKLEPVYRRVLAGEPALNVEISGETLAHVGVERHWVASYYPVRNPNHEIVGLGIFVSEVTERKKAEIALREQAAALVETARQKDEFIAMLSHELRNPLAPVRSALELLRRFGPQNAIAASTFDVMERQIKHMVRLLDDLLDVSRITSGRIRLNMQVIDMRQIVGEGIESARSVIDRRRHRLETVLPPEPLFVRGDATRLVQVLVNLLNNAAKYTPEGGTISLAATADGAQALLRVADTGAGISPRLLPRVFDLFTQDDRTLDRAQGGLGIGLTLVRRITELHGGTVDVHSPGRGQGSEFVVRLPRVVPDAVVAALPSGNVTAPSPRTPKRCLLVEDNMDAAQMLQIALELEGHKVSLAFDGDQALAMATTFQPDAVILDLGLPRLNGYDTARAIRQVPGLENVLIIAATGYGQQADRERSRAAGFDHHLVKPIDLNTLIATLAAGRPNRVIG
ncbi:MAG: hypothetical protein C5B57_04050 [Blastocatellia bacterium]|nr:MAG: hypothetical protein C5B57_04050 [Blastocatellia bacterium]